MQAKISDDQYRAFRAAHKNLGKCVLDERLTGYRHNDKGSLSFDHSELPAAIWDAMVAYAKPRSKEAGWNGILQRASALAELSKNIDTIKIKSLQPLADAIIQYIKKDRIRYWLFREEGDNYEPYLVTGVEYHPGRKDYPARVEVSLERRSRTSERWDTQTRITFHQTDLSGRYAPAGGQTVSQLLDPWVKETPSLIAAYDAAEEKFNAYLDMYSEQFVSIKVDDRYPASKFVSEGVPNRLVMDDKIEEDKKPDDPFTSLPSIFWDLGARAKASERDAGMHEDEAEGDDAGPERVAVPMKFTLKTYNLTRHETCIVHASRIEPYVYNPDLYKKLILPTEIIHVLDGLTREVGAKYDDIIAGKAGGIVVAAVGGPGTGKTISAEVYAEKIKRPLYQIQSAQLGTDPKSVEENLDKALARASKWRAVLQIDEADVYIRERGTDIYQNAIVGVFLRRTEYFKGMLFVTSNMGLTIDKAFLSRCAAVIEYHPPQEEKVLAQHFEQQLAQAGIKLDAKTVAALSKKFLGITGRSVKEMVKLVTKIATDKPTIQDFEMALRYQPMPREEIETFNAAKREA